MDVIVNDNNESKVFKGLWLALKILSVIGLVFSLAKHFFPATMEQFTNFNGIFGVGNIVRWFLFGSSIYLIMAAFFKNEKMANVAKLFMLPLALISIIFLPNFIAFNTSLSNNVSSAILLTLMILELIVIVAGSILIMFLYKNRITKEDFGRTVLTFLFIFVITVPLNIFEFLKNIIPEATLTSLAYHNFGIWHLIAVVILIVMAVTLFLWLRKKDDEEKWQILTTLGLAFIITYISKISISIVSGYQGKTQWFNMLPLYLCDIGSILIPFAMLFRKKFFLDNLFFVNAVGAMSVFVFMGIDSLNGNNYIFSYNYLYFILTHSLLFALSIMPVLLKLYKPKLKGILNGILVFSIVYFLATVTSAYISTIAFPTDNPEIYIYWMPNYCFTQICPLPLQLNFPSTTIFGMSFNIPYLLLLYLFYIAMFFAFQGLWNLVKLISKSIKNVTNKTKVIEHIQDEQ